MAVGGVPDIKEFTEFEENLKAQKDEIAILQSILEGDEDQLQILSVADTSDDCYNEENVYKYNMLKICTPVTGQDKIHIEVYVPAEETNLPNGPHGPRTTGFTDNHVQMARSESGYRVIWNFDVTYLPPVCMHITLPLTYPSEEPPSYVLSCLWLSPSQLTVVCKELDSLWNDNKPSHLPGMPILYTWMNWIKDDLLHVLDLDHHICLSSHSLDEDVDDCRVVQEINDLNVLVTAMLRYDRDKMIEAFYRTDQECGICFEKDTGNKFFLLLECNHHVCRNCLTCHCQLLVKEGTVQHLTCPMYKCKSTIPHYVLKKVLTADEFSRYESLALQKALEVMGDITWCPRCNNAVIQEPEQGLNLAHCLVCRFSFCTECMESWHQGENCKINDDMKRQKKETEVKKQEVEESEKIRMELLRQRKTDYRLSLKYIKSMAKKCPVCKSPIMKIDGCNKVVCTICGSFMCWACEQKINGYDHFTDNSTCSTFDLQPQLTDNADLPEHVVKQPQVVILPRVVTMGKVINDQIRATPELKDSVLRCIACRQNNIKEDRSNHIRCWNCKTSICFCCKQKINGCIGKHYSGVGACEQHS